MGQSSGAAMVAALRVARALREGIVVTVFRRFRRQVPLHQSVDRMAGQWRQERLQKLVGKWNASANATT